MILTILAGGGVLALIILVAVAWAHDWGEAVDRRRAWQLWRAGLIDDDELRRRVDR
jgi:hypothetical protein